MNEPSTTSHRWKRRFFLLVLAWGLTTFLLSFPHIRGYVASPLYVHDENARGDVAYVMADGYAYWERLHAASDLYNMGRVPRIVILEEQNTSSYSFSRKRSETLVQRAVAYLVMHGVPEDKVSWVKPDAGTSLGSLSEARGVASVETDIQSIVVVTSAPHTRRSKMAFRRSFPEDVTVLSYAATPPEHSTEVDAPIWMEYTKLVVYWFVA